MVAKVATLNLKDGLSGARRNEIQRYICDTIQPDIAVFPEAYNEFDDSMIPHVQRQFMRRGYRALTSYYNDRDGRKDRHGLMVIARSELVHSHEVVRMAEGTEFARSALSVTMKDPDGDGDFDFYGVHFDDRKETTRLWQAVGLLNEIEEGRPAIVAGDFNNMYRNKRATLLRYMGYAARLLGQVEPGTPMPQDGIDRVSYMRRRIGSLGCRLGGMAEGRVLALLNDANFYDDGALHEGTMTLGPVAIAELDHILARHMTLQNYAVEKPRLSDHHLVVAEASLAT